jgi:hypothetical protein
MFHIDKIIYGIKKMQKRASLFMNINLLKKLTQAKKQ